MKTWLIAASAIGGIYAPGMILLDAAISKKNMRVNDMPEYIEKGNALYVLGKLAKEPAYQHDGEDYYVGICEASGVISEMRPADVAPVRYGNIIQTIEDGHMKRVFSCCGTDFTQMTSWMIPKYCPECGAILRR